MKSATNIDENKSSLPNNKESFDLNLEQIIRYNAKVDLSSLRKFLQREGKIKQPDLKRLIDYSIKLFKSEPNLTKVRGPVTIVGDIHGQFYDLAQIVSSQLGVLHAGSPHKYVFLGDYVDRGCFSIEVMVFLLAMKVSAPGEVIMLRGNHECRQMTSFFNFRQQCLNKYSQQIYELFIQLFHHLPIACLVDQKFLCLHGGISHQLRNIGDIQKLHRFQEIPVVGPLCDILWSDPIKHSLGTCTSLVVPNSQRGCSYYFGQELARTFLSRNKLVAIVRAHQVHAEGYRLHRWAGPSAFPPVITVFSAPNYCSSFSNRGAVLLLRNSSMEVRQYRQSASPFVLPNFMDVFSWSMPYLLDKVTQMLTELVTLSQDSSLEEMPVELIDKKLILEQLLRQNKRQIAQHDQLIRRTWGEAQERRVFLRGSWDEGYGSRGLAGRDL